MWAMFSSIFASERSKRWAMDGAGSFLMLALAVAFHQGLYAPWGRDFLERTGRIEQLDALLATGDQVAAEHRHLHRRLGVLREAAHAARLRMPPLTSGNDFVEHASQIAEALGLEVVQCAAGIPQIMSTHSTVDVTCRLNGSFAGVSRFLAAIDQLSQITVVSRLELATAKISDAYPIQLTFQLYYQADLHDTKRKREAL